MSGTAVSVPQRPRGAASSGAAAIALAAVLVPAMWLAPGGARAAAPVPGDSRLAIEWLLHCSGCHGTDGAGIPGAVPDLRGQVGRMFALPEGRRYLLQVPGVANARLDDDTLAALMGWMLRAFAAGAVPADAPPYDALEVAATRRSVPADVAGERRRVIAALRARGIEAR